MKENSLDLGSDDIEDIDDRNNKRSTNLKDIKDIPSPFSDFTNQINQRIKNQSFLAPQPDTSPIIFSIAQKPIRLRHIYYLFAIFGPIFCVVFLLIGLHTD